jgi:hypothetical protein
MTDPNERKDAVSTIKRHAHSAAIALVVIGCALTIAAWGSSSKPQAPSRDHAMLAFKRCMRAHGVSMDTGAGINSSSPSFKAARAACDKLLPGFAHAKAQMLKISKCMRRQGISGFPNPTISIPPKANPARAIAHSGVILAVPSSINLRSPTFKHAAAVCGFPPDDWYPVHGGGPFADAGPRDSS